MLKKFIFLSFCLISMSIGKLNAEQCDKLGFTFGFISENEDFGTVRLGTQYPKGNPYKGDTSCNQKRSVLCIKKFEGINPGVVDSDGYSAWTGGRVRVTAPIEGQKLKSREAANKFCAKSVGKGYRMAEFHDGWGWNFQAYGANIPHDQRFWVAVDGADSDCWE